MPVYPGLGLSLWRPFQIGIDRTSDHYFYPAGHFCPTGHLNDYCGSQSDLLLVREVAMMHVMDKLTDKVDWHEKVFDDKIVAKWRVEALAYPDEVLWTLAVTSRDFNVSSPLTGIMSEKAFDYCIQELRGKAQYFANTGIVPILDATAVVAKSDCLIQPALIDSLRKAFDRLKNDQADSPDWHPGTEGKVLNLVHPSMYPLVYGSTKVLRDEVVGVADAVQKWAGKGTVIGREARSRPLYGARLKLWSEDYQWLPSNVALQDGGSVKFTSYINNLHSTKYPEIYGAIEKLVEQALPMWDQCISITTECYKEVQSAGRKSSRFSLPEDPSDDNDENWTPSSREERETIKRNLAQPGIIETYEGESEEWLDERWRAIRHPVVPEPKPFEVVDYSPPQHLSQRFKDTGLQVIVKMVSMELTPEKPDYPGGSWHVEGQMNEHICATALYYLDSENITTSQLSFRMQTDAYLNDHEAYQVEQDQYFWLERVHGTDLGDNGPCLQDYGSVETPQGRFLAFPNVFQHHVSPFRLVDPTKPGHRRFIALWLVDPNIRIISTANVPPQQQDWWVESVLGRSAESQQASLAKLPAELTELLKEKGLIGKAQQLPGAKMKLPNEILNMVREHLDGSPTMSEEEARDHRLRLMKERTSFDNVVNDSWLSTMYGFCEH